MAQHYSSDDEEDLGGVFQFLVGDLIEDAAQPQLGKGVITVPPPTSSYEQNGYQIQDKPYGAAEVRWFKQEYQRGSHKYVDPLSVLLLDRPLRLRANVTRWAEKAGPTGKVVAVKKAVDLEVEGGQVIQNIDSKKLGRVQRFLYGDYVVLGSWLGVVQSVEGVEVTIELPESGEKYVLSENQVCRSLVPEQQHSVYSHSPAAYLHPKFYPGQKVKCAASTIRKEMPWLKSKDFESIRVQAVVVEVSVTALRVLWLASRTPGDKHVPESYLRDPELKDLMVLEDIHHLVHQHALPTGVTAAELGSKWLMEFDPDMMQLERTAEGSSAEEISDTVVTDVPTATESSGAQASPANLKAGTVISSKTLVDVLWQDGTLSRGVDAGDLTYANCWSPGYQHGEIALAIWPHQFVREKLDRHGEVPDDDEEEEYADDEEAMRPEQGKGSGRLAFVHSVDVLETTALVSWFVAGLCRWLPEEPASLYELDLISANELQGQFDYGDIVIRPAPATSSPRKRKQSRKPASANHKKSRKPALLGGVQSEMDVKVEESGGPWVGVIVGYQAGGCLEVAWGDGSRSAVKHTEVETFREHQYYPGYNYMQSIREDDDEEPESEEEEEEFVLVEGDDHRENGEEPVLQVFKPFDTVKLNDDMDEGSHTFIRCALSNDAKWIKKVQKELNILRKRVPESGYVRVYEDRKDLLRAVIVGKPGTPYHDGLFAFDFHLPASFPHSRPSFVLMNANRQLTDEASQVVNQMWNPRKSTLLEVLQTIQDVVLTARPDTREAGHNTRGKKKVSASEQAQENRLKLEKSFMLHCNCILKTLKTPPQHFEKLVRHHFEKQGPIFLEACEAYLKGAPIGQPDKMEEASNTTSTKGFRMMLKKIIPRIQAELAAAGLEESLDAVGLA